ADPPASRITRCAKPPLLLRMRWPMVDCRSVSRTRLIALETTPDPFSNSARNPRPAFNTRASNGSMVEVKVPPARSEVLANALVRPLPGDRASSDRLRASVFPGLTERPRHGPCYHYRTTVMSDEPAPSFDQSIDAV